MNEVTLIKHKGRSPKFTDTNQLAIYQSGRGFELQDQNVT